jgi:hypothetical protein
LQHHHGNGYQAAVDEFSRWQIGAIISSIASASAIQPYPIAADPTHLPYHTIREVGLHFTP